VLVLWWFVRKLPVHKRVTFPKFLNFGKVRTTQKIKKLPIPEKLFALRGPEFSEENQA
jgi:hypothetical protein